MNTLARGDTRPTGIVDPILADIRKAGKRSSCVYRATQRIVLRSTCIHEKLEHPKVQFWGTQGTPWPTQICKNIKVTMRVAGKTEEGVVLRKFREEQPAKRD